MCLFVFAYVWAGMCADAHVCVNLQLMAGVFFVLCFIYECMIFPFQLDSLTQRPCLCLLHAEITGATVPAQLFCDC